MQPLVYDRLTNECQKNARDQYQIYTHRGWRNRSVSLNRSFCDLPQADFRTRLTRIPASYELRVTRPKHAMMGRR